MGLQIPRGVHPEVPEKSALREAAGAFGRSVPAIGRAAGEQDRRGTSDERSRTHDDLDTSEVFGITGSGIHQRQECDSPCAGVWRTEAQFCWPAFLGTRILCVDGWEG